ncbi:MAG: hypothetical protein QM687_04870 [Ferruginibacter sp.]
MSEINNHIAGVQSKLQQLLKQYELLQTENARQKELIASMEKEKESLAEQFESVRQQNLVLKASLSLMAPAEKKELEQRLNQYIRNIDKCISLLSQ